MTFGGAGAHSSDTQAQSRIALLNIGTGIENQRGDPTVATAEVEHTTRRLRQDLDESSFTGESRVRDIRMTDVLMDHGVSFRSQSASHSARMNAADHTAIRIAVSGV